MKLFSKKAVSLVLLSVLIIGSNSSIASKEFAENPVFTSNVELGKVTRVTVTFYGDTETSKGFTWYTNQTSAHSDLEVTEKIDYASNFENAIKFVGNYQQSTNAPEYVVHKAEATGLKPNTEYQYRVGDAELGIWSEVGTFETADGDGKFTFIDLADSQAMTKEEAILSSETFDKANETVEDSEFMILNGDIVNAGTKEEQWGWVLDYSKEVLLNTTFVAAAGNHEEDLEAFIEHFNLDTPEGTSTTSGAYYSYDYENVHFIVLNTNEGSKEFRDFTPSQIEWLEADATIAKEDEQIDWIIAVMHKGPYTTSGHATDDDIMNEDNGVRANVAPLFNQLGIDLVLQGHDHIYARTQPIKDGEATKVTTVVEEQDGKEIEYNVNPDGTIYLIPNTAGPKVYYKNVDMNSSYYDLFEVADEHSAAKYGADPNDKSRPLRSQIQNFVEFNIDGNKLTGITYEIDQNKDNAEPNIVDTFGIIKQQEATDGKETIEMKETFNVKEIKTSQEGTKLEKTSEISYTVKAGDTLYRIALNHSTTYQKIQKLNTIIVNHDLIYPGQVFIIPMK